MKLMVTAEVMARVHDHARATYPEECCGLIVECVGNLEAIAVANIQNRLHAEDPEQFPRTATTAYTMGEEAAQILLQADRGELRLHAFYHSHPEHGAYFSAEDRKQANRPWDEPLYTEAGQIVVSIYAGEVKAVAAFLWDPVGLDYVEVALDGHV